MNISTVSDVLEFVKEHDVKFIRLGFCDLFGFQKNIATMADNLLSAFENGVSFDAHAIKGFKSVDQSDLFLFPDPSTITLLPWRPGPGRVARFYCDIKNPDGTVFSHDSRYLLKRVVERCARMGYMCKIGAECEFYLFQTDEYGEATSKPLDKGGYLDISPLDKCENIRREICLTLEEMGIRIENSHHEQGPGQNEVDFRFDNALESADNFLTFKSAVKALAARNGLHASFMPKPLSHTAGSGLHVNLSLTQNGTNIFESLAGGAPSKVAESFIAGVLSRIGEITLFLNPLVNSYERFGVFEAPRYVSWSHQNRSQLIRIPAAKGDKSRMELRSPDPSANPYLAFALILAAGLDGMEQRLVLPAPVDVDLYAAPDKTLAGLAQLPASLEKAILLAERSEFVKDVVGEELLAKYVAIKKVEAEAFAVAGDKTEFYKERYLSVI